MLQVREKRIRRPSRLHRPNIVGRYYRRRRSARYSHPRLPHTARLRVVHDNRAAIRGLREVGKWGAFQNTEPLQGSNFLQSLQLRSGNSAPPLSPAIERAV